MTKIMFRFHCWWWSKGFSVSFIKSCYDDISGWAVDSEYSFPAF